MIFLVLTWSIINGFENSLLRTLNIKKSVTLKVNFQWQSFDGDLLFYSFLKRSYFCMHSEMILLFSCWPRLILTMHCYSRSLSHCSSPSTELPYVSRARFLRPRFQTEAKENDHWGKLAIDECLLLLFLNLILASLISKRFEVFPCAFNILIWSSACFHRNFTFPQIFQKQRTGRKRTLSAENLVLSRASPRSQTVALTSDNSSCTLYVANGI